MMFTATPISIVTPLLTHPLTVTITEADILVTTIIIIGVAAIILLIQGLLELAFTVMIGGATVLALWAVASTLPIHTGATFLVGLIILTVWFLIEA